MRPWQLFPPLLMGSQEGEISRLLSPSIYYGDCYAVGGILFLIYAALRALKWRGKGFVCMPSKTAFYCVTKWKRQARNGLLLTCLFLHPVWQLPYFSLLLDTVLWVAIIRRLFFFCRRAADCFIIQFFISCSYKSVLRSSITMTSGRCESISIAYLYANC